MAESTTTKRKSCGECVKAKRKCGMEVPRCGRCAKKDITCSYPNPRAAISDMRFPELEFPWLDDMMQDSGMIPWSGTLPSFTSAPTESLETEMQEVPDYLSATEVPPNTKLERRRMDEAVRHFRTYPDKWLKEGKAPFINPHLYVSTMPKALQDAYSACALYATKTSQNEFIAFNIIEAKANELIRSPNQPSWTPLDLLAGVQALLIFQFIRLFDGDIRQRHLAEQAETVLESWTEQLRSRTETERQMSTVTAPSWRAWIFAESARRTVCMSVFLRGIYSLLKKGFCNVSDAVTANCFTAQRALWDATSAGQWDHARQFLPQYWVSSMNFDDIFRNGKGDEMDDFGIIMMIVYMGQDRVDEWLRLMNADRNVVGEPHIIRNLQAVAQFEGVDQVALAAHFT